jgi:hypothetical protein
LRDALAAGLRLLAAGLRDALAAGLRELAADVRLLPAALAEAALRPAGLALRDDLGCGMGPPPGARSESAQTYPTRAKRQSKGFSADIPAADLATLPRITNVGGHLP